MADEKQRFEVGHAEMHRYSYDLWCCLYVYLAAALLAMAAWAHGHGLGEAKNDAGDDE